MFYNDTVQAPLKTFCYTTVIIACWSDTKLLCFPCLNCNYGVSFFLYDFFVWLGNWTRFVMTIGIFMFVINETKRGFYNIEIIFILYYLHISNYEFEFIFGFNEINKHWLIIIMKFWVRINFIISKSYPLGLIPGILSLAIWIITQFKIALISWELHIKNTL